MLILRCDFTYGTFPFPPMYSRTCTQGFGTSQSRCAPCLDVVFHVAATLSAGGAARVSRQAGKTFGRGAFKEQVKPQEAQSEGGLISLQISFSGRAVYSFKDGPDLESKKLPTHPSFRGWSILGQRTTFKPMSSVTSCWMFQRR